MAKGIRNSLIEKMGEKPSKPLSVRCCICKLGRRHPEMGPEGPCQQELLEKTFVKRGMALKISGAVGLGDVHRDICWMQERVK